jgi:enoyl-[acyl-carrier protein] reductase I
MGFLSGKRALIVGAVNDKSIAWGIAQAMKREGATLAFSYQNEKLKSRVEKLAAQVETQIVIPCDLSLDESIDQAFEELKKHWDSLDIIIHSAAFAPKNELTGEYLDHVTRAGFSTAHDISAYSFTALAKAGKDMLNSGGALLTLSYLGAVRTIPHYNVMGIAKASLEASVMYLAKSLGPDNIRVNAISAGPVRTLAASGIKDFRWLLDYAEKNSALQRTVTTAEIGNVAAFLCSDLASAVTGEITYVDSGFHFTAMGTDG